METCSIRFSVNIEAWNSLKLFTQVAAVLVILADEMKAAGGLFNFMRKTKKVRHQPEQEGIYLDDLNLEEMDPEVAALYIYHPKG